MRLLYKGTLRVLLLLLHDFPEFLCEFHFHLCDVIPPSCIQVGAGAGCSRLPPGAPACMSTGMAQALLGTLPAVRCLPSFSCAHAQSPPRPQMRNLVLSAFPRAMRLPDPFTPNLKVSYTSVAISFSAFYGAGWLKLLQAILCGTQLDNALLLIPALPAPALCPLPPQVDLLPEIASPPRFVPAPEQLLPAQLRAEVDSYLAQRGPPAFLMGLRSRLTLSPSDTLVCGERRRLYCRAAGCRLLAAAGCLAWHARCIGAELSLIASPPTCPPRRHQVQCAAGQRAGLLRGHPGGGGAHRCSWAWACLPANARTLVLPLAACCSWLHQITQEAAPPPAACHSNRSLPTPPHPLQASPPNPGTSPAMNTPHMEVFQHLLRDLDTGGRGSMLVTEPTC